MISETTRTSVYCSSKEDFPRGHLSVLQGLPGKQEPGRQEAAGSHCSIPDCLQTVNQILQDPMDVTHSPTLQVGNLQGPVLVWKEGRSLVC